MPWQPPSLTLSWPPYFRASAEDQKAIAETVRADLDAGIIKRQTAVEKLKGFYGIEDVEAYLDELEEERAENAARMHDAMAALGKGPANDDGDEGQNDPGQVGKAPPAKPPRNAPRGGKAAGGSAGNAPGGSRRRSGKRGGQARRGNRAGPGGN